VVDKEQLSSAPLVFGQVRSLVKNLVQPGRVPDFKVQNFSSRPNSSGSNSCINEAKTSAYLIQQRYLRLKLNIQK